MKFVSRAEWGARPPRNGHPAVPANQGVKVHYLGAPYSAGEHGTCAAYMRKVQNSHMDGNGWSDFAYNLAVCEHGYVFEGRGRNAQNAANGTTTLNRTHFAVLAFVGDSGHTSPTAEQTAGLRDAIAYLRAHGAGREIRGHRDGYATDCPGGPLYQLVTSGALEPDAAGPPPGPAPEQPAETPIPARYRVTINGLEYGYGAHGPQVTAVGEALVRQGYGTHYSVGPGPDWSDADTLNYASYQRSLGYVGGDADGVPGEVTLQLLLGRLPGQPEVSLAHVVAAARTDPGAAQGHQTYGAEALAVEQALADEGHLEQQWVDGSFGTRTVAAYAAYQRSLGYVGTDADGIPGRRSLERLATGRFTVTD
ncbi:peptidoglycan-binding protein [Kitasatospora sp. NPDC056184]|uniref:peptidoglycan-binding protein n=1 Tax=Kitasatospora sp. NPDC056184 TaxID=3345738 RepID=UPI0035E2A4DA